MHEHATDQPVQSSEEPVTDVEGVSADANDVAIAAAVAEQAEQSSGADAVAAPEVPDDASAKIAAAQKYLNTLDMDEERAAARRAI